MKICTKCGDESEDFTAGKSHCRPCRAKAKRGWRSRKANAGNDASEHEYGDTLVPEGFGIKKVSILSDAKGNTKLKWTGAVADKAAQAEILMRALKEMAEEFRGIVKPTDSPWTLANCTDPNLLTVIPMGDPHIGMHSWHEETGEDFDLKIAQENMESAFAELMAAGPPTRECLIVNLGDYFHADNHNGGASTTAGTPVDVDGRRVKVVRVGLEIFTNAIMQALAKHEIVHVICATGNHDADSSKMLAMMLGIMFANEPRVNVNVEPTKHHKFRWGKVLFGITHGDTGKHKDLPMIMAHDWKEDWAECEYYQWLCGHVHHSTVQELTGGVMVETFRTLAPSDSWHKGQGYRSGRDIKLDVWHKEWGHMQRNTVGIRRIVASDLNGKTKGKL